MDNNDWDVNSLPDDMITPNNTPKNNLGAFGFLDMGLTDTNSVRFLSERNISIGDFETGKNVWKCFF